MGLKQLIVLIPLVAGVHGQTWTLRGYDYVNSPDTDCSAGTLGVDEVLVASGTGPQPCTAVPADHGLSSVYWDSGGPADQTTSFFVCFYNQYGCPGGSAVATLPEGDFGCTATTVPQDNGGNTYYSVKASSDGGC